MVNTCILTISKQKSLKFIFAMNVVTINLYETLLDYKDIEAVPWLVISVNGVFVKRAHFSTHVLNNGDEVELIYIRGGG